MRPSWTKLPASFTQLSFALSNAQGEVIETAVASVEDGVYYTSVPLRGDSEYSIDISSSRPASAGTFVTSPAIRLTGNTAAVEVLPIPQVELSSLSPTTLSFNLNPERVAADIRDFVNYRIEYIFVIGDTSSERTLAGIVDISEQDSFGTPLLSDTEYSFFFSASVPLQTGYRFIESLRRSSALEHRGLDPVAPPPPPALQARVIEQRPESVTIVVEGGEELEELMSLGFNRAELSS